jgi:hypothetical protein
MANRGNGVRGSGLPSIVPTGDIPFRFPASGLPGDVSRRKDRSSCSQRKTIKHGLFAPQGFHLEYNRQLQGQLNFSQTGFSETTNNCDPLFLRQLVINRVGVEKSLSEKTAAGLGIENVHPGLESRL